MNRLFFRRLGMRRQLLLTFSIFIIVVSLLLSWILLSVFSHIIVDKNRRYISDIVSQTINNVENSRIRKSALRGGDRPKDAKAYRRYQPRLPAGLFQPHHKRHHDYLSKRTLPQCSPPRSMAFLPTFTGAARRRQSELESLKMQINPHFLYNTLDTINWMARIEQKDDIA